LKVLIGLLQGKERAGSSRKVGLASLKNGLIIRHHASDSIGE
jgi:hypothetical protein